MQKPAVQRKFDFTCVWYIDIKNFNVLLVAFSFDKYIVTFLIYSNYF